jgi:hypothetical protein
VTLQVRFDHQAVDELRAAHDWYDEANPGLGGDFVDEVWRVIERIVKWPALALSARFGNISRGSTRPVATVPVQLRLLALRQWRQPKISPTCAGTRVPPSPRPCTVTSSGPCDSPERSRWTRSLDRWTLMPPDSHSDRYSETKRGHVHRCDMASDLVGVAGFEPTASSSRTKRATKLRHTPSVPSNSS